MIFDAKGYVFGLYKKEIIDCEYYLMMKPTMKNARRSATRANNRLKRKYPLLYETRQIVLFTPEERLRLAELSGKDLLQRLLNCSIREFNKLWRYINEDSERVSFLIEEFAEMKYVPKNLTYCVDHVSNGISRGGQSREEQRDATHPKGCYAEE